MPRVCFQPRPCGCCQLHYRRKNPDVRDLTASVCFLSHPDTRCRYLQLLYRRRTLWWHSRYSRKHLCFMFVASRITFIFRLLSPLEPLRTLFVLRLVDRGAMGAPQAMKKMSLGWAFWQRNHFFISCTHSSSGVDRFVFRASTAWDCTLFWESR